MGDNELVFTKNPNVNQSVNTEETLFARTRDRLGCTQRYSHNNRFKINLHALRAFTVTQLAEAYSEEFGHEFIGHKGYLKQYIRNKEQLEKYTKSDESLLVVFGSPEKGVHEIIGGRMNKVQNARSLNFFPDQATETVRLEEALLGTLAIINASK